MSNKSKRTKDKSNYYESHHILPRSLGGCNEKSNLVLLTAREHFIAHKLLVKVYPDSWQMKLALLMMSHDGMINSKGVVINSRHYNKLRDEVSEAKRTLAFIPECLEFDNNILISARVSAKVSAKRKWSKSIRKGVRVVICNAIVGYGQNQPVCYRRSNMAYTLKNGKCTSHMILKAIDMLVDMVYVENIQSDADVPVSKRKLSVYKLTELGYYRFTTLGEKI